MSQSHGFVLTVKRNEEFERVAAYTTQLVSEKSKEQLGKDMTAMSEKETHECHVGLIIDYPTIGWHDYGWHGNHLDTHPILEQVAQEFPHVDMFLRFFWGAEIEGVYKQMDGDWIEISTWTMVVHTDNETDYQAVVALLKSDKVAEELKERLECRSVSWEYDHLSEEESLRNYLYELSKKLPQVRLMCYQIDENYMFQAEHVNAYCVIENGEGTWREPSEAMMELMGCMNYTDCPALLTHENILFHSKENIPLLLQEAQKGTCQKKPFKS